MKNLWRSIRLGLALILLFFCITMLNVGTLHSRNLPVAYFAAGPSGWVSMSHDEIELSHWGCLKDCNKRYRCATPYMGNCYEFLSGICWPADWVVSFLTQDCVPGSFLHCNRTRVNCCYRKSSCIYIQGIGCTFGGYNQFGDSYECTASN